MRMLLDRGAFVNGQDDRGRCALLQASFRGHTAIVDLLLARGSIVDQASADGITPLHGACIKCQEGVVLSLLAAGASATVENNDGLSAMDWATSESHAGVRRILQQHLDSEGGRQQPRASASSSGQAGGASEGWRRRQFRFECHAPECSNSEVSLQRLLKKCDRCRRVRYCSTDCLAADWPVHKVACRAPRPPSLDDAPSSAHTRRAAVVGGGTSDPAWPGPCAEPRLPVSVSDGAPERSVGAVGAVRACGSPGCSELARSFCGRCESVWYCSAAHQKEHWPQHKLVCRRVSADGAARQ